MKLRASIPTQRLRLERQIQASDSVSWPLLSYHVFNTLHDESFESQLHQVVTSVKKKQSVPANNPAVECFGFATIQEPTRLLRCPPQHQKFHRRIDRSWNNCFARALATSIFESRTMTADTFVDSMLTQTKFKCQNVLVCCEVNSRCHISARFY